MHPEWTRPASGTAILGEEPLRLWEAALPPRYNFYSLFLNVHTPCLAEVKYGRGGEMTGQYI